MLIFDFFAGTGSATKAFEDAGDTVIKVESDGQFDAEERDILKLNAEYLISKYGQPDFIWASPPCQKFSVAALGYYWEKAKPYPIPKHPAVFESINLVKHTLQLITDLNPKYGWIMENPRGMLRKQEFIEKYPRQTVTYCSYGDFRMKPTDLWGFVSNWLPRTMCKPRQTCHESAPSGSTKSGTRKLKNPKLRSMVPYQLGKDICDAVHKTHDTPKEHA